MDDDQQFCLRWNNHQSTLISVIDTLLVKETLVDCTLAAEGKYLKAHKVVLCACSPYFETLLSQQFDKHPIIILKDVKFQELKAMMDYMYRGEVNISQDQLAALLKAAESLQIKGLSDNRKSDEPPRKREALAPPVAKSPPPPGPSLPHVKGLTIEQKRQTKQIETEELNNLSREGSQSPIPRKRKKPRRRASQDDGTVIDNHDASNSSDATALSNIPLASAATSIPVPSTSQSKPTDNVPAIESVESIASSRSNKNNIVASPARSTDAEMSSSSQVPVVKEKLEPHSELMLEPKAEYIDEDLNDDSVEDLTLDDDDMNEMGLEHARAGPSHGGQGEGSGQGFGSWHMAADRSQDEVFMAAQEAVGAHRDSQGHPTVEKTKPFETNPELLVPWDLNVTRGSDESKEIARKIHQFYFNNGSTSTLQSFVNYVSDVDFIKPIRQTVKLISEQRNDVYLYQFSFEGDLGRAKLSLQTRLEGTTHGDDNGYIWLALDHNQNPDSTASLTRDRMVSMWTNFAKTGNPTPNLDLELMNIQWPKVELTSTSANINYMDIGEKLSILKNPREAAMQFWDRIYSNHKKGKYIIF